MKDAIAIVGIDCRYPGADNIEQYWENILSLRQQFRRIPDKRLNLDYYYSADKSKVDHTYSQKAAVLSGYHFDRVGYKVAKSTYQQTDLAHWLALDVAAGALRNAGFEHGEGLDKNRVGVVLGNSLNGEFTRSNLMRGRWPYVFKVLQSTLEGLNYAKEDIATILTNAEKVYKEPFPDPDADTLAGGLSNTIAGRICNYFDFHGGGFTVDGACSSSLLAIQNGCNALINGEVDVVVSGGVDLSIDPFEIIGFARNGALALHEMEVYSSKSAGFWPGEGCGIVVLMRAEEAIERKLNIYALIKGWGISSDGNGGITRPKSDTQMMAYDRAYERAGYGIDTVALFEGHGTGTTLGDQVELTAVVNSLRKAGKKGDPAIIGSVKHLIGHTKAAAGVAGILKATLAVKNGILPPSRPTTTPNKILVENADILALAKTPKLWEGKAPLRAAVASMGFGGINVHLTLEEADNTKRFKKVPGKVAKLASSLRDCEIFPLSAPSREALQQKIDRLAALAKDISRAEFIDLGATLCASFEAVGSWKAGIVAATPDALQENLHALSEAVQQGDRLLDAEKGIFFDATGNTGTIGFLFPGQGAPVYEGLGAFGAFVKETAAPAAQKTAAGEVADTAKAQPAILQASLQCTDLLEEFGVEGSFGIGNSLGEISAMSWAGVIDREDAIEVAKTRGHVMSTFGEKGGAMLALKCSEADLHEVMDGSKVSITGYNGHGNYVVGGPVREIDDVQERAVAKGLHNVKLKVSHAFHTPMMKEAAAQFATSLGQWDFHPADKAVYSTITGQQLAENDDIAGLLFKQIEAPVLFTQAIESVRNSTSFFIEVGPGNGLTRTLNHYKEFTVIPVDFGSSSVRGLLNALAAAYVAGNDIQFAELSLNRFYRPFDINNWKLDVLVNPCEQIDFNGSIIHTITAAQASAPAAAASTAAAPVIAEASVEGIEFFIKKIVSEKTEIPVDVITGDARIMSELHINSLAITEIISVVTKTYNKSAKVSSEASILANGDGTIRDLSTLIFKGDAGTAAPAEKGKVSFEHIDNWTFVFERKNTPRKAGKIQVDHGAGKVSVKGLEPVASLWEKAIAKEQLTVGNAAVYVYDAAQGKEMLGNFVSFLNHPDTRQAHSVTLVNLTSGETTGDLRPVLRSFQLEASHIAAMSLEIHSGLAAPEQIVAAELKVASKYKEVIYDAAGERKESQCEVYFPAAGDLQHAIQPGDVILATGGGKGITFESVMSLATATRSKVAILGRSTPEKDAELSANLQKLSSAGVDYRYYSADVLDTNAIGKAIADVKTSLGPVRVLIHGAGVNKPKTLINLTPEDFARTVAVKVDGLRAVVESLDAADLRVLIGYGSIIAESGMEGNADYAWANDQLAQYIERFAKTNVHCRCLTLEWSVWDETGMGVSLNSIGALKKRGVYPIPVKQGVAILKAILADSQYRNGRLIISGRYGELPTLIYPKTQLPLGRFISKIKNHVPGVEVVSEVNVNLNDDIYLTNHVFQNQYVFPTVMILEGMAQVCSVLYPDAPFWNFEHLKINKSIFVPKQGSNVVRFIVTRTAEKTFKAVVQSEDSSYEVNCFEATINLAQQPDFRGESKAYSNLKQLDFNVEEKFYDDLLFHHGPFRRINSFLKIQALESIAKADSNLIDQWFGAYIPQQYLIGDPGLNDAAIHCHQACRPGYSLLPTGAGQIAINPSDIKGPFFIKTIETREEKNSTVIDVCVMNSDGEIKLFWKDLTLTTVTGTEFKGEWDPHLLVPYLEYKLMKLSDSRKIELSLSSCLQVVESLQSVERAEIADVQGYSILLNKVNKHHTNGNTNGHANGNGHNGALELNIAKLNEKVVLHISPSDKN